MNGEIQPHCIHRTKKYIELQLGTLIVGTVIITLYGVYSTTSSPEGQKSLYYYTHKVRCGLVDGLGIEALEINVIFQYRNIKFDKPLSCELFVEINFIMTAAHYHNVHNSHKSCGKKVCFH